MSKISHSLLLVLAAQTSLAQIPRRALEEAGIAGEINQTARVSQLALPESPGVGTNNQTITVAPVFQPGNTSLANSGGVETTGAPGQGGGSGSRTEEAVADRLRTLEIDPAQDTVIDTKRNAVWNVGDNRAVDARFERFLNLDAAEDNRRERYLASLNELLHLMCPRNPYAVTTSPAPDRKALAKAYSLLRQLGSDELDHEFSTVIANAVDSAHAAETDRKRLYAEVEKIEKEIDRLQWNIGVTIKSRSSRLGETADKIDPEAKASRGAGAGQEIAAYTRKLAQQQSLQVAKYAQAEAKQLLAKADFQGLLLQLFAQRRFQHVLIACAFYKVAFGDGELEIKTEGKVKEALTKGGVPLTVATLEGLTTEAILETRQGVNAVKNMLATRRVSSGEKRLAETYFIGEHLPEMQTFPRPLRNQVLAYRQSRREVAKAIEVKDYARARSKNASLVDMATDYDPAPVQAAISAAESESNFHLAKARNAATTGDKLTTESELRAAAAVWPQNPALTEGSGKMMEQFDRISQNLKELDTLLEAKDLRAIESKRELFAAAVATDEKRQNELRAALDDLLGIEKALERAKELDQHGSPAEAWLAVEAEARRHPTDPKLVAAISHYNSRAPEFVTQLTRARENRHLPARAINHYLAALKVNPACGEAREQITQLAETQLSSID